VKYRLHVSALFKPSSGQFNSFNQHDIEICARNGIPLRSHITILCFLNECNWPEDGLNKAETCSPFFTIKHRILVLSDCYINILVELAVNYDLTAGTKYLVACESSVQYS
jgi:hypothetical protein